MLALITGASDGIGKAYAYELAKKNYNLILIARREEKLKDLQASLQSVYNISALYYSIDLSENINEYCQIIREKKPDILINSAGFGRPGLFGDLNFACHEEMLKVHIEAIVKSNYEALKYMKERKEGLIINVSSLAGLILGKGYTMYGSTKQFIADFSQRLAFETRKDNIYIQALCPGFTNTGFHDTEYYPHFNRNKYPKFLWQSPESVARESLKKYKTPLLIPRTLNRFIYFLSQTLLFKYLIAKIMKSSKFV